MLTRRTILAAPALWLGSSLRAGAGGLSEERWWPTQRPPKGVVRAAAESVLAHMLLESAAGLAACAVNEGRLDEMIWIAAGGPQYEEWYAGVRQRLGLEERATLAPWETVQRFERHGIIRGYVLYRYDRGEGRIFHRAEVDESVNVATMLAGPMQAILVEESQESEAKRMGLRQLADARGKDLAWFLEEHGQDLGRSLLMTTDPKLAANRDMAILNRCAVGYGMGEAVRKAAERVTPPAPVLGWNAGRESQHTGLVTDYGLAQASSHACLNLPLLSAGSERGTGPELRRLDPHTIDWNDRRHLAAFLMSDGNNLSWAMDGFFGDHYWGCEARGQFPMGWMNSPGHLGQVCPEAMAKLAKTQTENDTVIEQGGGYFYPDRFGRLRSNRTEILATHGRRLGAQFRRNGARVLSFICRDVNSQGAREAYEIFSREIEGLAGMVALQYYPYEAGHGRVFWLPNRQGIEIPVVTLTHALWAHARWPTGGSPGKIARLINARADAERFSFATVHAWSAFREADHEEDEEPPADPGEIGKSGAIPGLQPVSWCVGRLNSTVKVVTPEELIWRLRMKHDPSATKEVISKW